MDYPRGLALPERQEQRGSAVHEAAARLDHPCIVTLFDASCHVTTLAYGTSMGFAFVRVGLGFDP